MIIFAPDILKFYRMKKLKKLKLRKETIVNLDEMRQMRGGVGPSLTIECPGETMMNPLTIGPCCDVPTLSDYGCGNFTRGKYCPSCI